METATKPKKLSLRQRVKALTKINEEMERLLNAQNDKIDKMAENMTHMILRLEGVRYKFNLTVDDINKMGEEHLARQSAAMSHEQAGATILQASSNPAPAAAQPSPAPSA